VQGGLVAWILEHRKVTNKPARRKPVSYQIKGKGRANEAVLADVIKASNDKTATLLDVRSDREYLGHPRVPRSGHVPGAQWWPWEGNVNIEQNFYLTDSNKISETLAKIGVKDKKQPLIVYCRSGHRAAQSYLTLRNLGYENVRLYDGSMAEYSKIKSNPLTLGSKP
jgi:thiosulfate/3-mercaptopyruvate sulfurtransferase